MTSRYKEMKNDSDEDQQATFLLYHSPTTLLFTSTALRALSKFLSSLPSIFSKSFSNPSS